MNFAIGLNFEQCLFGIKFKFDRIHQCFCPNCVGKYHKVNTFKLFILMFEFVFVVTSEVEIEKFE